MNAMIFYYTGTGNSLWVARQFAAQIGGAELICMPEWEGVFNPDEIKVVGLVFPVYIWGVPAPVIRFIKRMKEMRPQYIFAAAVNGGQVSATLVQLQRLLKNQGLELASGFSFVSPSNYIPWGGPGTQAYQQELFDAAQKKIAGCARVVRQRELCGVEKGPLWQRMLFSLIYKISFDFVPKMDSKFQADEKCNHCGVCVRVCPADNITLEQGIPVWRHRCEQCFACLQWCPQESIQYGKRTIRFDRYHHPEIKLKDVLRKKE